MRRVITYGTFDLLHHGHINLLKRAKELGDYLIVGVTSDSFDKNRGKLNVTNNVLERIDAVRATGLADEIIIEDYVGQKIDDLLRYNIDVFAIGSDWEGKFDYLREFCEVVYLPRTQGVSSTQLRNEFLENIKVGIVGCGRVASRFPNEAKAVSGVVIEGVYDIDPIRAKEFSFNNNQSFRVFDSFLELIEEVNAVYIASPHLSHYLYAKEALEKGKHVLCETPLVLKKDEAYELFEIAKNNGLVLLEANKTAFCPAFNRLVVMIKSGVIGEVVDIEASLSKLWDDNKTLREFDSLQAGGSMYELGSYPLLPIIRIMGMRYQNLNLYSRFKDEIDMYTKGVLRFQHGTSSFKVALGVKTEGNLIISGTKGYAYIPAPWWKTDYYELRYENQSNNKKFFYQWDGDGLRYEIKEFLYLIKNKLTASPCLSPEESICMARIMEQFGEKINLYDI